MRKLRSTPYASHIGAHGKWLSPQYAPSSGALHSPRTSVSAQLTISSAWSNAKRFVNAPLSGSIVPNEKRWQPSKLPSAARPKQRTGYASVTSSGSAPKRAARHSPPFAFGTPSPPSAMNTRPSASCAMAARLVSRRYGAKLSPPSSLISKVSSPSLRSELISTRCGSSGSTACKRIEPPSPAKVRSCQVAPSSSDTRSVYLAGGG